MQTEQLVIERTFNAPRELVFKAWTSEEHLAQWWGPSGFKLNVKKMDLVPGGIFHYSMTAPDGKEMWGKFIYREIVAPERIIFVNSFSDADGNTTENPWMRGWPLEILNELTLTERDGKTKLILRGGPLNATAEQLAMFTGMMGSMQQGFKGTFDALEEHLLTMVNI